MTLSSCCSCSCCCCCCCSRSCRCCSCSSCCSSKLHAQGRHGALHAASIHELCPEALSALAALPRRETFELAQVVQSLLAGIWIRIRIVKGWNTITLRVAWQAWRCCVAAIVHEQLGRGATAIEPIAHGGVLAHTINHDVAGAVVVAGCQEQSVASLPKRVVDDLVRGTRHGSAEIGDEVMALLRPLRRRGHQQLRSDLVGVEDVLDDEHRPLDVGIHHVSSPTLPGLAAHRGRAWGWHVHLHGGLHSLERRLQLRIDHASGPPGPSLGRDITVWLVLREAGEEPACFGDTMYRRRQTLAGQVSLQPVTIVKDSLA